MLEGLEAVEVKYSDLLKGNESFRIDSEFLLKEYVKTSEILKSIKHTTLSKQLDILTDGKHDGVELTESGVIFLRNTNIKENRIDLSDLRYISEKESEETLRAEANEGDLLLTTIGTVGLCVKVPRSFPRATINQNLVRIVLKNKFISSFVCCFLNSKYGRNQLSRYSAGNVYQMINYPNLKKLLLPEFNELPHQIDRLYSVSESKISRSNSIYFQAESLLLEILGLRCFHPNADRINIKGFKESFLSTGRLDAEYYQKKYEDYINLLKRFSNGYDSLNKVCNLKDNNYNPENNRVYKYIELADIGKSGDVTGCTTAKGSELPTRARLIVNSNDVIISSIEGSLDSCAVVTDDYDEALCSTGFYVINSIQINSETLLVLFKSELMQSILKQKCTGTILTAINKQEFQNILIPLIDFKTQKKISELVKESFRLKKQAEQILEAAKKGVEIAIEENEDAARIFLNNYLL